MSDTAGRNPNAAAQMLADALLRTVAGSSAAFRVTGSNPGTGPNSDQSQLGLVATTFAEVVVSPVVLRRARPNWVEGGQARWELLVSATGIQGQVDVLELDSAKSLFAMTMVVSIAGQDYLIESIAANEALGAVYLYRLLLREAGGEAV